MKRKIVKPRKVKPARPTRTTTSRRIRGELRADRYRFPEPCFQCDLDIGHVCFNGIPNAKWGMES
jgi:hypothetical protein